MMNDLGGTRKDNERSEAVALLPRRAASLATGTVPSVSANTMSEPAPVDVYADLAPCVREALADPATEDVIVDGSLRKPSAEARAA